MVARTAGMECVGSDPGRRIDARLHAQCVDLVAHGAHVGEFFVRRERMVRAGAGALPGIVDIHVGPAVFDQSAGGEGPGGLEHFCLIDFQSETIPGVPAHGRRERDPLAHDDAEVFAGGASCVLRREYDGVFTRRGEAAGDLSRRGIDGESFGQPFDGELHWPLAGGGDAVEEGMARADSEEGRAVDARLERNGRCEDFFGGDGRSNRLRWRGGGRTARGEDQESREASYRPQHVFFSVRTKRRLSRPHGEDTSHVDRCATVRRLRCAAGRDCISSRCAAHCRARPCRAGTSL